MVFSEVNVAVTIVGYTIDGGSTECDASDIPSFYITPMNGSTPTGEPVLQSNVQITYAPGCIRVVDILECPPGQLTMELWSEGLQLTLPNNPPLIPDNIPDGSGPYWPSGNGWTGGTVMSPNFQDPDVYGCMDSSMCGFGYDLDYDAGFNDAFTGYTEEQNWSPTGAVLCACNYNPEATIDDGSCQYPPNDVLETGGVCSCGDYNVDDNGNWDGDGLKYSCTVSAAGLKFPACGDDNFISCPSTEDPTGACISPQTYEDSMGNGVCSSASYLACEGIQQFVGHPMEDVDENGWLYFGCDGGDCEDDCGECLGESFYYCSDSETSCLPNDGTCDGECIIQMEGYLNNSCSCFVYNEYDEDGVCSENNLGCTYEEADNFNSSVLLDDGSCIFPECNVGDWNGDEIIDILDIVIMVNYILDI